MRNDIFKTKKEIEELGYFIENSMIKTIDVRIIPRFANCVMLEIILPDCILFHMRPIRVNFVDILLALNELLELDQEESGVRISTIKDIPCRAIFEKEYGRVIGIGHFMKDKFVIDEDLFTKLIKKEEDCY